MLSIAQVPTHLQGNPWGTEDPYWNFSVAGLHGRGARKARAAPDSRVCADAAEYYADQVGGEAAAESAVIGAVFFDESDLSYCGFWSKPELGCGALSTEDVTAQHAAAMMVLANLTKVRV